MPQASLARNRAVMCWFLATVVAVGLGCVSTNYTVEYNEDGSGVLYMNAVQGIMKGTDVASWQKDLAKKGWQDVQLGEAGENRVSVTAKFPFDTHQEITPLKEYFHDVRLQVRQAENGYKYYAWDARVDFSPAKIEWDKFAADFAANGLKDDSPWVQGQEQGPHYIDNCTPEVAQHYLETWPKLSVSLKVKLPGHTPVDCCEMWEDAGGYKNRNNETVTYRWDVETNRRAKGDLKVERRLEPETRADPSSAEANFQELMGLYAKAIPKSPVNKAWLPDTSLSGPINNTLDGIIQWMTGQPDLMDTCADYQARILDWLGSIRCSADPHTRGLLAGWRYGPIMTQGGTHRAVIIYRSDAADWTTGGIVLDPWPEQAPRYWPVREWNSHLRFIEGKYAFIDSDGGNDYPHLRGLPESYPATGLGGDLPRGRAVPETLLLVRCPVSVLLTLPDGRRIGALPDGTLVNELGRKASFYPMTGKDSHGDMTWLVFLPVSQFRAEVTGTGNGEFHTAVVSKRGVSGFGSQPIAAGQKASFSSDAGGRVSPLTMPDGTSIPPQQVANEGTREMLGLPAAQLGPVWSVAWSPDGARIAAAEGSAQGETCTGGVVLLEPQTMKQVGTFSEPGEAAISVAFSPDGTSLAASMAGHAGGGRVGRVDVWDLVRGRMRSKTGLLSDWVASIAFSPDGRRLATACWDHSVSIWDPRFGTRLGTLQAHEGPAWSVAWSPDGRLLASGAQTKAEGATRVVLWDIESGNSKGLDANPGNAVTVALSPDGQLLATGGEDKRVVLWEVASGTQLVALSGHTASVSCVAFSADGSFLASGSYDKTVRLWDVRTGAMRKAFPALSDEVTSLCLSPDGRSLVAGTKGGEVKAFELAR